MKRWKCHRTRDDLILIHMDTKEWIEHEKNIPWDGADIDKEKFIKKQLWLTEFGNLDRFSVRY